MGIVESDHHSRSKAVAVAAVVLLVFGTLIIVSLSEQTTSTDTRPPSNIPKPSATEPITTPATAQPTTPTYIPPTVGSIAAPPIAPTLGDFRVYVVATSGRLAGYLDGRSGHFVERFIPTPSNISHIRRLDNGRILLLGQSAHIVDADLVGPAVEVPLGLTNAVFVQPGDVDRLWVTHQPRTDAPPMFEIVEVDLSGRIQSRASSPIAFRPPIWLQGREVLVAAGGRIYLRNVSTATTAVYAIGDVQHVETGRVVWRSCPTIDTCRNYVGTTSNPTQYTFTEQFYVNQHPFSPDGNFFVLGTEAESFLIDLRTGTRRSLGRGVIEGQTWSPDSGWLFLTNATSEVRAIEISGDREVKIELPIRGRAIIAA